VFSIGSSFWTLRDLLTQELSDVVNDVEAALCVQLLQRYLMRNRVSDIS